MASAHHAEQLLNALVGIVSVRAVVSDDGVMREIHVLADQDIHPKQVVRNIESALCAGLGLEIDRRIVSVAQVEDAHTNGGAATDVPEPDRDTAPGEGGASAQPAAAGPAERLVFVGFDTRARSGGDSACEVTLRAGSAESCGQGEDSNTPEGRARAAARATIDALGRIREGERLGLEGAALVEAHGRDYVVVGVRRLEGRAATPLTGAALLARSPEEAAILATLQATNRRASFPA